MLSFKTFLTSLYVLHLSLSLFFSFLVKIHFPHLHKHWSFRVSCTMIKYQCKGLIKLVTISLSLLQGERQDLDGTEERNAQVQLEKAKVRSHCSIVLSAEPTHNGAHRLIFQTGCSQGHDYITDRKHRHQDTGLAEQYSAIKMSHCSLPPSHLCMCSKSGGG